MTAGCAPPAPRVWVRVPGSSSGRGARSRGSDYFPITGRPASPGPRRLAEGSPEAGAPSLRGRSGSSSAGSAAAGSALRAPEPTQKGRPQLLSFMYRTDQKFPESAAFTHRRLHRPLHVPLPLPSSRAFSKDSTQWGPGPRRDDRRCHGAGEPLPSYWLSRPGRPLTPPPPSRPRLFAVNPADNDQGLEKSSSSWFTRGQHCPTPRP